MTHDISKNVVMVLLALVVVVSSLGTLALLQLEPVGEATSPQASGQVSVNIGSQFQNPAAATGDVSLTIRDAEES